MKNHRIVFAILMATIMGLIGAFHAPAASAAPATSQVALRGQCGGPSTNMNQLIGNLMGMGVLDDIGRQFHIRPVDDSVDNWIRRNVGLATMARTATFGNKGCSHGTFFGAKPRTLHPGDRVWVLTAELKKKFPNGFSLAPRKGWQRKMVCVKAFDNPTCTNPLTGEACIWVWVPPTKKAAPPKKPKKTPVTKPTKPVAQPPSEFCVTSLKGNWNSETNTCVIQQGQCSQAVIIFGNGNYVNQGPVNCPAPPAPPAPPVPPTPPTPPTPPVINNPKPAPVCFGTAAHMQTNRDDFLFCEVVVPNGATITGETIAVVSGPSGAYVNGLVPSSVRWDGTACPSGTKCYRAHMWSSSTAGDLKMTFSVTALFATGPSTPGSTEVTVPIKEEVPF